MKILTVVKKTGYNFIRHYLSYLPKGSEVVYDARTALSMIPLFDVILFEWANDLTTQIVNSDKFRQLKRECNFKTVVRIHDHEVTKTFGGIRRIDNIDWTRVDKAWFINPGIQKEFHRLKGQGIESFFIPNAVDPNSFHETTKEEKRVGLASIWFRPRKRIDRVVEIAKLVPEWTFYIRSHVPGRHERFYDEYAKIKVAADKTSNVVIEHRDANKMIQSHYKNRDLQEWYKDKAIVLSTSSHEGFHYVIAQGMLTGCKPVVFDWPTSKVFWKPFVVDCAAKAAESVRDDLLAPSEYRKYVIDNFGAEKLCLELQREINRP